MELKKISENVTREFDAEGNAKDRVDQIRYRIEDGEGNQVGNITVNNGQVTGDFAMYATGSVEDGDARLKALFGSGGNEEL